jgi:hypothetical protein
MLGLDENHVIVDREDWIEAKSNILNLGIADVIGSSSNKEIDFKVAFNELACCVNYGMTVENTKKQLVEILSKFGITK